jgi:benzoate-CoA ligase family protein
VSTRGPKIEVEIPEQINLTTYYLEENLTRGRGEKIAIYYQDRQHTFNELCAFTNRVGNVLRDFAVDLEDRVLLILQDSPEWLASWFGAMKIGSVPTHAYTYLQPSDYEYFFNYVRPRVVIADATTLDRVREGARSSRFPKAVLVAGKDLSELCKGEYPLNDLVQSASPKLEAQPTSRNDLAYWNFSGGTTGKPKGVPHMHHDGVIGFESHQYIARCTPDDVVLRVPKLFFHYSRDLGMNWALRAGAAVVLFPEKTTVELIFDLIDRHRPTVLLNVPTMMRAMLQSPQRKDADLSCLRLCIASGELLSAQLYREFTEAFGVEVLNVIGSAEAGLGYLMDLPGEVLPGSSGKVMPLIEVKLVDNEGNEVPKGQTGILYARSDGSGFCYHMEPDKTKRTFVGNDWVNTNDLFREDENGYFWYGGRADDLIKVSGVYVAPLEIEQCLELHPMVKEIAVVGVRDKDGLAKTKAFVVLNDGFEACSRTEDELRDFCKQKMAPYKSPRLITFVNDLPKTGQGKIDKRMLIA